MRLAVIQHAVRGDRSADVEALAAAIRSACDNGAEIVVCPSVPSIVEDPEAARPELLGNLAGCAEGTALLVPFRAPGPESESPVHQTPLGDVALLLGDECLTESMVARLMADPPDAIVLRPLCESELQAEAMLERAISLSAAVSGLVMVAECDGADLASPGHGGSAIVSMGEVVAESLGGDDILLADVPLPLEPLEPREPLAPLATILEQRIAHHEGRKVDPGYLADLS